MNNKTRNLEEFASKIRVETLKMLNNLGFGHYGGSMSIVETLAALYGEVMKYDPKNPQSPDRDFFILSKGHAGPALYSTLGLCGFFPISELSTLNKNGTNFPSHPDRLKTPGVDATTGSLGQGISIAAGIALSHKLSQKTNSTYCIIGDGELNEGQCWEAFQFIAHHKLNNLITFIDYNKKQLDGTLEEVIEPFDLVNKFSSFGFEVRKVKGDNAKLISSTISDYKNSCSESSKPLMIVLDTVKGQGVEILEKLTSNHHIRLDETLKAQLIEIVNKMEANNV